MDYKQFVKTIIGLLLFCCIGIHTNAQKPLISSFSPRTTTTGIEITILGSGFGTNASDLVVHFGSVNAAIAQVSNDVLVAVAPAGSTYSHVSVTNLTSGLTGYSALPYFQSFSGAAFDPNAISAPNDFQSEDELYDLSINDFDGDGLVDVITANNNSNLITVYQNTSTLGNIGFTKKFITINSNTLNVASCDLNGDGKPDAVISKSGNPGDRVYILKNNSTAGNIVFANPTTLLVDGNIARRIEIQDLDKDGLPEIIVTNQASNKISIYKNKSTIASISFEALRTIDLIDASVPDLHSSGLAVKDLNGDGYPEIAVTQFLEKNVYIIPNLSQIGNLQFGSTQIINIPGNIINILIGDINLDDKPDLIISKLQQNQVSVLLNNGSGSTISFGAETLFTVNDRPWGLDFGDVNGDGKVDIIASSINYSDRKISILENQSVSGTLNLTVKYVATPEITRNLKLGDMDKDGKPDFVLTSVETFNITVLRNENCFVPKIEPAGPLSICTGSTIILEANKGLGLTYQWNKDNVAVKIGIEDSLHISVPGVYNVIATSESGSCIINSNAIIVNLGTGNAPNLPVIVNNGPFCEGDDIVLTTDPVTNGVYEWSGPNGFASNTQNITIPNANAFMAGTYALQVSVDNCTSNMAESIVQINSLPSFTILANGLSEICQGSTVDLSVQQLSGYSYQWNRDGVSIPGATASTYTADLTGAYSINITEDNSLCMTSGSNTQDIRVLEQIVADFTINGAACTGIDQQFVNQSVYSATDPVSFEWNFGDGSPVESIENPVHNYSAAGNYNITLNVQYTSGICGDLMTLPRAIGSTPIFTIEQTPPGQVCDQDTIILSTSAAFSSYLWSTGETTQDIFVTASGNYSVTVGDIGNCNQSENINVVMIDRPVVSAIADKYIVPAASRIQLEASGAQFYSWTPGVVLDDSTKANPIAFIFETTQFIVEGSNSAQCTDTAMVLITISEGNSLNVKPMKAFTPNGDGINDFWEIEGLENYPDNSIVIFNGNGSNVFEATPYNNDWDGVFKGITLSEGTYFYVIRVTEKDPFSGSVTIIR